MENLLDNLKKLLKKDERLISEDELLKNKIIELAIKLDKDLIKLLLSDKKMKEVFFVDIDGTLIFDKDKFIRFVSNKQFLPDSYTSFKNKIGLIDEKGEFISKKKEVVLSWPYKDCVLEGGMTKEDQKRDEIFWNEILAPDEITRLLDPKVFTNAKRIDAKGEHKLDKFKTDEKGDIKDNLIIKGNNLLALHSLKKRFAGKVKLIYIDPPYNTGKEADEFKYNDAFNHSTWLTFMKNRLEVAKDLLREDGTIFISIDDNEQAYLKVLCDEVFGRENFIASMPWKGRGGRQDSLFIASIHEYVLFFCKNNKKFLAGEMIKANEKFPCFDEYKKLHYKRQLARKWGSHSKRKDRPNLYYSIKAPDGTDVYPRLPDGSDGCWRWSKEKMQIEMEKGNIEFIKENNGWIAYQKIYEPRSDEIRTQKFTTWLDNIGTTSDGTKEVEGLFGEKVFRYPKPPSLIKRLLEIGNVNNNDIVLDFFAGSGTTAQAVSELNKEDGGNRQFILCEQLDYVDTVTIPRVKKVIQKLGGGDFVYLELMRWNENFADEIKKAKSGKELQKLWETMKKKAHLSYKVDIAPFDKNAKDFADLSLENQKRFLLECLDKNHLYVNYSEIDDEEYGVSEEDKKLNREFYGK
jgi:adenine-specific DNA-methyltransferase